MLRLKNLIGILLLAAPGLAAANTAITPGTYLYPGQRVTSGNGKYFLIQQTDGNLVYYRNDGVVRFATYQYGAFSVMQHDGNFVQYNSGGQAVWATHTQGTNNYLLVQDNGDLAVYRNGTAIFSIGPDPDSTGVPDRVGDIAGREMTQPGLAWAGHIALWTGSNLVESNVGGTNAVRYVAWDKWKVMSPLWGIARPNIPSTLIYDCFNTFCDYRYQPGGYNARSAIAQRANQQYLLGGNYTPYTNYAMGTPAEPNWPATRGTFRCDTFVLGLMHTTGTYNENAYFKKPYPPADWLIKLYNIENGTKMPANIFNGFKW